MGRVDHIIRQATDVEQMMSDVLQTMLDMFKTDRAWLLYPCDPEAESWSVPMERTRPEYPGALALGEDIPMLPEISNMFNEVLDKDDVITIDYRDPASARETAERFSILTQIHMALHPPTGEPWMFGMHQCSYQRDWTSEEKDLFREIGRRLGDGLGSLLALRDLRASEERWRSLTMHSPDHVMLIDGDGTIRFCNYTLPELSIEQVLGTSIYDYIPKQFRQTAADCFKQVVESQLPGTYEAEYNAGDGTVICFETRVAPVLDQGDTLILNSHDITKRKRAEEELRHLRSYLSNIINSMPSVLVGVDPDGIITQWNLEAERSTGLSTKQAVGQPLDKAIPRLSAEMMRVRQAIAEGRGQTVPKRIGRKHSGETVYEDITVYPLIANGVKGAVIRVDDVTERVRMEEMMVQSEKMLSVGGLAAGMAHEINNPLAAMMQNADVMRNRLTNENLPGNRRAAEAAGISMEAVHAFVQDRDIPHMIAMINESGRRVAEIVKNMFSFSHKSNMVSSSHDVAELLDRTLELAATDYDLKKHYDFKTIKIVKEYAENLPFVPCEEAKIQQVLLNILKNGAQAMQGAGVEKAAFILRTHYDLERARVCVEIEDNGPGMDKATRRRIFEPFFTTKPVGTGTGLGLSVSYFIITENHGGEMDVVSEPGQGTNFIIRLPVERRRGKI
ncbi:MAG: PAS domain S-box protein, partial [Gammaproteobacteria bacterium]|nr:PAS domain S-box protein [Gammaproteobacteria bacterium]